MAKFGAQISFNPTERPKGIIPRQTIMARALVMIMGITGLGLLAALMLHIYMSDTGATKRFLPAGGKLNNEVIAHDQREPGDYNPEVDGEGNLVYSLPLAADLPMPDDPGAPPRDVLRGIWAAAGPHGAQLMELEKLEKAPLFKVSLRIQPDSSRMTEDEIKEAERRDANYDVYDFNLKREWYYAPRDPLPHANPEKGPFHKPFQMETPRVALDDLVRDVAGANAASIRDASNGERYFFGNHPNAVSRYRGRVFEVSGMLWMLREQPLRAPDITHDGAPVKTAYYGVAVFLRRGIEQERPWVNQAVAFTTLSVPDELKPYVIKAGESPTNDDPLAAGKIGVRLRGAYFRRIMYREPVATGLGFAEKREKSSGDVFEPNEMFSEEYMPWLVCQGVDPAPPLPYPSLDELHGIMRMFGEDTLHKYNLERDRFDEAGYYLLVRSLTDPANPLATLPRMEPFTVRNLLQQSQRDQYRGARIVARGTLQPDYFALILPPNISGRRNLYRTLVLDALNRSEEQAELQWHVDMLEPPLNLRGRARVEIDGAYYRSQVYATKSDGRVMDVAIPLLLTTKLVPFEGGVEEKNAFDPSVVYITVGAIGSVLLVLTVLMLFDRRARERFERETLVSVRHRMGAVRERIAREKKARSAAAGAGETSAADAGTVTGPEPPATSGDASTPPSGGSEQP